MKRKMMTKKKILIGSIFAALLMVSMPFIPALQTAPATKSTSVQPSSSALAAVTKDVNLIKSIDPKTATPEQIIYVIQLGIDALRNLGYKAKATEIDQKLQGSIGTLIKCALVYLALEALLFIGVVLEDIAIWYQNRGNQDKYEYYSGLEEDVFEQFCSLGDWLWENCPHSNPKTECNICAGSAGSITPMTSN